MARLLVVCTGNTCRSPMLLALLKARGIAVDSAGTAAVAGDPASDGARAAMFRRGLSLDDHRSTPVLERDLGSYDQVWAMTPRHAAALRQLGVPAAILSVVNAEAGGVPDPYGGDDRAYEACAQVLEQAADLIAAGARETIMPYDTARLQIDAAHRADPAGAELLYADRMEAWILRLDPQASPILRLAARCQHLERWTVPRASFPMDKAGYLRWRRHLYTVQAERARAILVAAGVSPAEADQAATWISKADLKGNAGTQTLEDAACLVFLENEISAFATAHADYPKEKFIDIIRKTWKKMSERGHQLALTIDLPPGIAALVQEALA